jgi:hypothetical protein
VRSDFLLRLGLFLPPFDIGGILAQFAILGEEAPVHNLECLVVLRISHLGALEPQLRLYIHFDVVMIAARFR